MSRQRKTGKATRRRILQTGAVLSAGSLAPAGVSGDGGHAVANRALQGTGLDCGDAVTGELTEDDASGVRGERFYQDEYSLQANEDDFVTVAMNAIPGGDDGQTAESVTDDGEMGGNETEAVENGTADGETEPADDPLPESEGDPYLYLLAPDGTIIAEDEEGSETESEENE